MAILLPGSPTVDKKIYQRCIDEGYKPGTIRFNECLNRKKARKLKGQFDIQPPEYKYRLNERQIAPIYGKNYGRPGQEPIPIPRPRTGRDAKILPVFYREGISGVAYGRDYEGLWEMVMEGTTSVQDFGKQLIEDMYIICKDMYHHGHIIRSEELAKWIRTTEQLFETVEKTEDPLGEISNYIENELNRWGSQYCYYDGYATYSTFYIYGISY